jgi:Na+/melibiose symporter-like transporter
VASYSSPQGYPGTPGPAGRPPRNGLGIAALVVGVIGLLLFWTVLGGVLLGIVAVVLGIIGFRRAKKGEATNGAMALIGAIAGGLALVASVVIIAAGVSLLNSEEFDNLEDCLRNANSTAEEQQCERDFRDEVEQR